MIDWLQLVLAANTEGQPRAPIQEMIWLFVLIGLAFYFIIIRPQKREQAEKQKLLSTVEKGDRVVTIGGIHGTVASVDQQRETVLVDVGKNVRIDFSRQAIARIEKKGRKSDGEGGKQK
jgi:preprotein translocase subunit YajC